MCQDPYEQTGEPVADPFAARRPDYAHAELRRIGLQYLLCVLLRVPATNRFGTIWLGDTRQALSAERAVTDLEFSWPWCH
ncbi:MAG: hypothetical protein IPH10_08550 [bacterium]|nr:hypothetical protein [bacterium]